MATSGGSGGEKKGGDDQYTDRDSVRTALFSGAPKFRSELVEIDGVTVEVRQPSIRVRRELFNKCTTPSGNIDPNEFLIWSIIKNTYLPGSRTKRVFEDGDYEQLMNQPTGGWVDTLIDTMSRLTNPESAGKGETDSDKAPSDASSSSSLSA